jgi:hypothetical protein
MEKLTTRNIIREIILKNNNLFVESIFTLGFLFVGVVMIGAINEFIVNVGWVFTIFGLVLVILNTINMTFLVTKSINWN